MKQQKKRLTFGTKLIKNALKSAGLINKPKKVKKRKKS